MGLLGFVKEGVCCRRLLDRRIKLPVRMGSGASGRFLISRGVRGHEGGPSAGHYQLRAAPLVRRCLGGFLGPAVDRSFSFSPQAAKVEVSISSRPPG